MRINPETPDEIKEVEAIKGSPNIRGIRKRIQQYSRYDVLTGHVLSRAYYEGLNGEDTMTLLAFEALKAMEKYYEALLNHAQFVASSPIIITVPDKIKNGE